MADCFTKEKRSEVMSKIRSKWTLSERRMHNHLKGMKIKHEMHPKIEGSPDILLKDTNTVVFIDGCFWHKCPKCWIKPKTNKKYWLPKIEGNVKRDRRNRRGLRRQGYKVVRLWEHDIKSDIEMCIRKSFLKDYPPLLASPHGISSGRL